ncbi:MAG: hypothetical protein ACR2JQ_08315 [Mycobacteriales bacterium]
MSDSAVPDPIRSELFIAGSDDEAIGIAEGRTGASDAPPGLVTPGLTTYELDVLQSTLSGEDLDDVIDAGGHDLVASARDGNTWFARLKEEIAGGDDDGPWLSRMRPDLTDRLATLAGDDLAGPGEQWAARREMADSGMPDPAGLLPQLADLAAAAGDGAVYLWTSAEPPA